MLKVTLTSVVLFFPYFAHAQTSKCSISKFDGRANLVEQKTSEFDSINSNLPHLIQLPSGEFEGEVADLGKQNRSFTISSKTSKLSAYTEFQVSNALQSLYLTNVDGTFIQFLCFTSEN